MSAYADGDALSTRVESLAGWVSDLEAQLRATSVTGDAKTLKELAKALEAWNKHDPKLEKRLTERVDVLADRFATLSETVNTTAAALAGKGGEIAQLRRELEEGNARIESLVRDLRQGGTSPDVAELRKAIATLSTERIGGADDRRVDAIASDIDVLSQRLDTLSKTVSTTASALAGKEGELASLRSRLEDGDVRADSLVAELRTTVAQLSHQVASIDDRPGGDPQAARLFESHLLDLGARVEQIGEGLDAVSASVATTTAGVEANETELADVRYRFEEASARIEAMLAELGDVRATVPDAGPVDPEVEDRLAVLAAQIDELSGSLVHLDEEAALRTRDAIAATLELERLLDSVTHRLGEVERAHAGAAAEVERIGGAFAEERTWVRDQLDLLAGAVEQARPDETVEPRLQDLASRIGAMEHGQSIVGAEVARIAAAWDAERDALRRDLESVAASVQSETASTAGLDERSQQLLAELTARLGEMEREGTLVADEVSRVESRWSAELGSLASRLEEIAAVAATAPIGDAQPDERVDEVLQRLDALEHVVARPSTGAPGDPDELRDIRVLINGLRMRLASSEKELAALSGSGDVVSRLDDISLRLGLLERAATAAPVHEPTPGDGRFRVELRGIEQRMQSIESSAQESRDAVLTQFERLASRLQWRLQQLEHESSDAEHSTKAPAPPLGQVVPLRGEA
jgi:chromosome segregation ATPase